MESSMKMPELGSEIYIPFSFWTEHEKQIPHCIQGGLATIIDIYEIDDAPEFNKYFIKVKEVSNEYNLKYLLKHQEEWKEQYKDQIAQYDSNYNYMKS